MAKKTESAASPTLELGEHQSIRNVGELHHRLMEVASHPDPVAIDAGSITKVDTAAMQALLAFVLERRRHDHGTVWTATSERFQRVAAGLGLGDAFGLTPTAGRE
ncbi:MAG: STAS domain-containing protein [Pseudomonadota bacterium]